MVSAFSLRWMLACGLTAALGTSACQGRISGVGGTGTNRTGGGSAGTAGGGSTGTAGGGSAGGTRAGDPPLGTIDPGRVVPHRLNNLEYNNTVRDLFGTTTHPAAMFLAEEGFHFDNTASALVMTPGQYDGYFRAADDLMVEAMANPTKRARFMICTPVAAADPCARRIIETFGKQIQRRPLEAREVDSAMMVYDADFARTKNGGDAIALSLRAMLSSLNFLYRVEQDPNPASVSGHTLSGYELASRLSYLHWSSMPDAALFDAAASGQLLKPATLESTVDRLLADTKASAFVESFAGQWLDTRELDTHSISREVFSTYTDALRDAIRTEGNLWFQDFLTKDRPLTEWFTADFNYVNGALAQHYGFPAPATPGQFTRVEVATDQRKGFLGLASFLTRTSVPSRTSPTTRGVWVLSELLCDAPAQPPNMIPVLEASAEPGEANLPEGAENVAKRLAKHREAAGCAACHATLDPIGLGLERFDGIGRYRETYGNGDAIAQGGELPGGKTFAGPRELGTLLAQDPRFVACVAHKMFTYAMGREVEAFDAPSMQQLKMRWAARGQTIRNLLKEIVVSEAFRFRRGEL